MRAYNSFSQAPWLEKTYLDLQDLLLATFAPESSFKGEIEPEANCAEAIGAISDFCEVYSATRAVPTRAEMEEVWSHCCGLPIGNVSDSLAQSLDVDEAFEWQPRLRILHLLQHLQQKGGAAELVAEEVLVKAAGILQHLAEEVPQCQPMARQLLQKTSGADSIETCSVDDENPHYQVSEGPAMEAHKPIEDKKEELPQDLPVLTALRALLEKSHIPKMKPPQVAEVHAEAPESPFEVNTSRERCPNFPEEDAGGSKWLKGSHEAESMVPDSASLQVWNPMSWNALSSNEAEVQKEDLTFSSRKGQRPYLWLSAVGAVDFESSKNAFSDLGLTTRMEI